MRHLILASTSRYRAELLGRLGIPFEAVASAVDETAAPGEAPDTLAQRLASAKAHAVAAADPQCRTIVIGADQTAALGDALLTKPGSAAVALEQLIACRGRSVRFYTAVTIVDGGHAEPRRHLDTTDVQFAYRSDAELERYIEIEQPLDCAGAFKSEGLGVALFDFVRSDDPTALIGLPLIWVAGALRELGLNPLQPNDSAATNVE